MPFISSVRGSYGAQGRFGKRGLGGSTGGTITTAGGFNYHTFTTVGTSTFTPSSTGNIEMIMVAAGGGGGASGAGAGGLLYTASTAVTTSPVSIVLGSAGIGRSSAWGGDSVPVSHGENTTVTIGGTTFTARGGQGARGWDVQADTTLNVWGSGSGGPQSSSTPYTGGGYTPGQGFPGGDDPSANASPYPSGGGGGAGAKGGDTNSASTISGNGGNGLQYSTFATATGTGANGGYYAGGGAGCNHSTPNPATSGGLGGGGSHPGGTGTPSAGVNGTGGGGSGGTNGSPTSAGGTGIVIIRYPV